MPIIGHYHIKDMKLKLKKGLKLNIAGGLMPGTQAIETGIGLCAVIPDDFPGFMPKVCVHDGDMVAAGTPLLFDKKNSQVKLVSPISGRIRSIVRGERRKIMRIEIEAAETGMDSPALPTPTDRTSAHNLLAESGLLAFIRQRPYDIVPKPGDVVRDIFVTALDTAPLAASMSVFSSIFTKTDYTAGVALLRKITDGKVYICHGTDWQTGVIDGAEMVEVDGPHPAGNAGVQAANIAPVNKGETIWTLDLPTLGRIGRIAAGKAPEFRTIVAIVGPEVSKPALVKTIIGAKIAPLIAGRLDSSTHSRRIISGNVLTGDAVGTDGFIRYPYRQITVIAEGDDKDEFMGWASLSPSKMSESPSFPGHFLKRKFRPDARLNGGRRAMIMSGQYDKVMPMDILPEYLLKAIMSNNIEDMERLGIYEVAPEDFAAAEYVDTSKLPLQQIVRDGLDYIRKELE